MLVKGLGFCCQLKLSPLVSVAELGGRVGKLLRLPSTSFYLLHEGRLVEREGHGLHEHSVLHVHLRLLGGIDFQHREGSKTGSGGHLSESQAALERKERLRKLALETIDITKDPYIMRNHLGTYECKLCLTLHPNEGNYLAHTQGKRHQSNLGRRAAMEGDILYFHINEKTHHVLMYSQDNPCCTHDAQRDSTKKSNQDRKTRVPSDQIS